MDDLSRQHAGAKGRKADSITSSATVDFVKALSDGDIDEAARAPKTDLHSHSILAARFEDLVKWSRADLSPPPQQMAGLPGMIDYVNSHLDPVINTRAGIEFTARSGVENALMDGAVVLEMSFDAAFARHYERVPDDFLAFVSELRGATTDLEFRPEVGVKWKDVRNPRLMNIFEACIESGVFNAIDLYGDESAFNPEAFTSTSRKAHSVGMRVKAHVGEFGPAENVRLAVEILELDSVQHGIRAAESEEVMNWLARNEIPLHVCPESNVRLGAVESLDAHPIRALYDRGVPVTINSDDLTLFDRSVTEQYMDLFRTGSFSADELDDIRKTALIQHARRVPRNTATPPRGGDVGPCQ